MECRLFETAGIAAYRTRADWDAAAVEILGAVLTRWGLERGAVYTGGFAGTVLRVICSDGSPAVLKVGFPHEEAVSEAIALQSLAPGMAPRVLRQDPWSWAMLLEEVRPGTTLVASRLPVREALTAGAELLARVAAAGAAPGVPTLETIVGGYSARARARLDGQRARLEELGVFGLVVEALDELDELTASGAHGALVHGDFNPGNILRAHDGWRVVDPKPMAGDSSYDLWPLVSQLGSPFTAPDPVGALEERVALAADVAGLDPVRAIRWSFARSGLNVTWYLEDGNATLAAGDAAELKVWARVRDRMPIA